MTFPYSQDKEQNSHHQQQGSGLCSPLQPHHKPLSSLRGLHFRRPTDPVPWQQQLLYLEYALPLHLITAYSFLQSSAHLSLPCSHHLIQSPQNTLSGHHVPLFHSTFTAGRHLTLPCVVLGIKSASPISLQLHRSRDWVYFAHSCVPGA